MIHCEQGLLWRLHWSSWSIFFLVPYEIGLGPKKVPIPCNIELDLQASVCHFLQPSVEIGQTSTKECISFDSSSFEAFWSWVWAWSFAGAGAPVSRVKHWGQWSVAPAGLGEQQPLGAGRDPCFAAGVHRPSPGTWAWEKAVRQKEAAQRHQTSGIKSFSVKHFPVVSVRATLSISEHQKTKT